MPERADGIHVQRHAGFDAESGCRHDRLQGADLVVRRQERRHGGIPAAHGGLPRAEIDGARRGRLAPTPGPRPRARCSQFSVSIVAWCSADGATIGRSPRGLATRAIEARDPEIHRLGAARGEDDLDRVALQCGGESLAGVLEHSTRGLAGAVDRRSVADPRRRGEPRLPRLGSQRRRGGVVEVDDHGTPPLDVT